LKRIWRAFLPALHVSRILLQTSRKGTAYGCPCGGCGAR
jgi:hypothetical protein